MPSTARVQSAISLHRLCITGLASALTIAACTIFIQTAQASVTASRITSPSSPLYTLNNTTLSNSATTLAVAGTFTGSSSERLAINCYYADGSHETVDEEVEGKGGSFSTSISSSALMGGAPCVLRAVSAEDYGNYSPGSESPFQGPTVVSSELYVSTFAGTPFDYDLTSATLGDGHAFSSVGGCGLGSSQLYASNTLGEGSAPFACDAALYAQEPLQAGQASQSEIQIDGLNAYGPYAAEHLFGGETGVPSLGVTSEFDPSTGLVTVHETDPLVVCSPDPATFPPSAQSCSSFVSAGVSLQRTWQTEDSGALVSLNDSWTSTDGTAHSLVALYNNDLRSAGAQNAGFMFPGSSSFSGFADEASFTLPAGSGSIYYTPDRSGSSGGGEDSSYAAISYDTPPDAAVTFTRGDTSDGEDVSFVMPYKRTIPPGGAFTLRMSFAQASTLEALQSQAREAVAAFAPTLSISEPTNGATLSTATTIVSGEVAYDRPISTVTVDGSAARVSQAGAWSAPVTLLSGANTITVTATGEEGLSTSQAITVTDLPSATPPEESPTSGPPVSEPPTLELSSLPEALQQIEQSPDTGNPSPTGEASTPANTNAAPNSASPPPRTGPDATAEPAFSAHNARHPVQQRRRRRVRGCAIRVSRPALRCRRSRCCRYRRADRLRARLRTS